MLNERQEAILELVIREYVADAEPVSSEQICRKYGLNCSSATVRHELNLLEEQGYLFHPHTSAGRVPTDKGYRFYVDKLMKPYQQNKREKQIIDQLHNLRNDMDDFIRESLSALSSLFEYTVMATIDPSLTKEHFFMSGLAQMLDQPEFNDAGQIKSLVKILDQRQKLIDMFDESPSQGVGIKIGKETAQKEMDDLSLVVGHFHLNDETVGSVAVLGPKRMPYERVSSMVSSISETIDDLIDNLL
jgi:transcriptional regulator of heat shock response